MTQYDAYALILAAEKEGRLRLTPVIGQAPQLGALCDICVPRTAAWAHLSGTLHEAETLDDVIKCVHQAVANHAAGIITDAMVQEVTRNLMKRIYDGQVHDVMLKQAQEDQRRFMLAQYREQQRKRRAKAPWN